MYAIIHFPADLNHDYVTGTWKTKPNEYKLKKKKMRISTDLKLSSKYPESLLKFIRDHATH